MTIPIADQIAAEIAVWETAHAEYREAFPNTLPLLRAALEQYERALAVVEAARSAWAAFTDDGAQLPVFRTDEHLPEGYWSPAGRMTDTAAMVPIRDALAAFDTARRGAGNG